MRQALLAFAALALLVAAPALASKTFTPYQPAKFNALVQSGAPVVVHVHADWCPTCRRQQPLLDEIFSRPEFGSVATIRVDFDKDTDFRKAHRVNSQSTVLVFKGGKEVARGIGDTSMQRLLALAEQAL